MVQRQKVIKVGNSMAVTLDKSFVREAGIAAGQEMVVVYKPEKGVLSMAKSNEGIFEQEMADDEQQAYVTGRVTPELEAWTKKFLIENQEVMKRLADL